MKTIAEMKFCNYRNLMAVFQYFLNQLRSLHFIWLSKVIPIDNGEVRMTDNRSLLRNLLSSPKTAHLFWDKNRLNYFHPINIQRIYPTPDNLCEHALPCGMLSHKRVAAADCRNRSKNRLLGDLWWYPDPGIRSVSLWLHQWHGSH